MCRIKKHSPLRPSAECQQSRGRGGCGALKVITPPPWGGGRGGGGHSPASLLACSADAPQDQMSRFSYARHTHHNHPSANAAWTVVGGDGHTHANIPPSPACGGGGLGGVGVSSTSVSAYLLRWRSAGSIPGFLICAVTPHNLHSAGAPWTVVGGYASLSLASPRASFPWV